MLTSTRLLLLLSLTACASYDHSVCPDLHRLERRAALTTFRDSDGVAVASGRHLDSGWRVADHLPAWQNVTPVGPWEYRYPNGQLRARFTYALSCYIQCCSGGSCPQVHAYAVGPFELWYPNGAPRARGSFLARRQHVDTSCEGGDTTTRSVPSSDTQSWNEAGALIPFDARAVENEFRPLSR